MTERGYLTPLRVENVDAKYWIILEDFCWKGSQDDVFTVHRGQRTDFATVPWWTQSLLPRTGTWTKAAVLHDKMCEDLNQYHAMKKRQRELLAQGVSPEVLVPIYPPTFSSIDTDAIFRKNARDDGTDPVRSELLWFGVRCGALVNPGRRKGWLTTFPRFLGDLVAILAVLVGVIAGISWLWPW